MAINPDYLTELEMYGGPPRRPRFIDRERLLAMVAANAARTRPHTTSGFADDFAESTGLLAEGPIQPRFVPVQPPQPAVRLHPQSEMNPTYGVSNETLERARGRASHAAHVAGLQYQGPLQDEWRLSNETGTGERLHIGQFRQPDRSGFRTIADDALREERVRNTLRFARARRDSPGPGVRPEVEAGLVNVMPWTTPVDPRLGVTPHTTRTPFSVGPVLGSGPGIRPAVERGLGTVQAAPRGSYLGIRPAVEAGLGNVEAGFGTVQAPWSSRISPAAPRGGRWQDHPFIGRARDATSVFLHNAAVATRQAIMQAGVPGLSLRALPAFAAADQAVMRSALGPPVTAGRQHLQDSLGAGGRYGTWLGANDYSWAPPYGFGFMGSGPNITSAGTRPQGMR